MTIETRPAEAPAVAARAAALLTDRLTAAVDTDGLTDLYRDLHRHPELSMREHRTADALADRLRAAGYETTQHVGETGVVGVLRNGQGPTVMLRGDMDALPVQEETGLPYASRHDGVMHACGHDLHVTWLAGAAEALAAGRDTWSGTLVVVGQPGEETGEGARAMVEDGLHERFPRPDAVLGQHVSPGPQGMCVHTPGLMMAASAEVDIVVHGRGGHGSRPENTVDPILTAAHIVTRLQGVVSREIAAKDSAVLTVGRFRAGTKHNIIPPEARLALTLRSHVPAVQDTMVAAIRRIAEGECAAAGCPLPPEVTVGNAFPATVNDAVLDREVAAVHRELLGEHAILDIGPQMGSEDFSRLAPEGVPFDYWLVPASLRSVWHASPEPDPLARLAAVPGNHSPHFAPDPGAVPLGVRMLVGAALSRLARREGPEIHRD